MTARRVSIAIPSRSRWDNVEAVQKIVPDCTWFVSEAQEDFYKEAGAYKVVTHPDGIKGIGPKRQWILDYHGEEGVFMMDDDITHMWCNVGKVGRRIEDPAAIRNVIESARQCASDAGAPAFGFAQSWDVRKFKTNDPFSFGGWVGSAYGVISHDYSYDPDFLLRCDIDFSLNLLAQHRYLYRDTRFAFVCQRFDNPGGLSLLRTEKKDMDEVKRLIKKWGKFVSFRRGKTRLNISLNVQRKQGIRVKDFLDDGNSLHNGM